MRVRIGPVVIWLSGLLFLVPAAGQEAGEAQRLQAEIRCLETWAALAVTAPQAEGLLPLMADLRRAAGELETARLAMLTETSQALVAVEYAVLRGQVAEARQLRAVTDAVAGFTRSRQTFARRESTVVQQATALLSVEQRSKIESDADQEKRLELEQRSRLGRTQALAQARNDILSWARSADQATFTTQREQRTGAILALAYPGVETERLATIAGQLGSLYQQARGLAPQAVGRFAGTLDARLRAVLPPLKARATDYALSASQWRALLADPVAADVLVRRLPSLRGEVQ